MRKPAPLPDGFLELASAIGHVLRSAGTCPTEAQWVATKDQIRSRLQTAGMTGAQFDAHLRTLGPRKHLTRLERMGL